MLFIIPGFPFITSGIDLAKLDMRSGMERLFYSVIIIAVATLTAWIMALLLHLTPIDFPNLNLEPSLQFVLRLIAGFCGVFGFSIMFNSRRSFGIVTQKQIRLSTNCYHSAICGYYDSGIVHISCSVQFRYNVTHCGS